MNKSQAKFDHTSKVENDMTDVNLPMEGQKPTDIKATDEDIVESVEEVDDTGMDFIKQFVDSLGENEIKYLCEYAQGKSPDTSTPERSGGASREYIKDASNKDKTISVKDFEDESNDEENQASVTA